MYASKGKQGRRSRELRRRVVLPARLRAGALWSEICILNISSRGLMIHSARAAPEGTLVELRRGDHVIVARVVWRHGARAGLWSGDRLPVEEILSSSQSQALQLTARCDTIVERREDPRPPLMNARLRGRAIEFIGVIAITTLLAINAWTMMEQAFARPLARVAAALAG
jgi:hypothetical protein